MALNSWLKRHSNSARVSSCKRLRSINALPRVETLEDRCVPSTFTVTNTSDSGTGSLRQAIMDANGAAGADTIAFSISGSGVHTISPSSALPDITDTVAIDGTTQPGYAGAPLIELNGASAGNVVGLTFRQVLNSSVRGL